MRGPVIVITWLTGASLATGVGFGAITALGEGLSLRSGQAGLVSDGVLAAADDEPVATPTVRATPTPTPTASTKPVAPAAVTVRRAVLGGTVVIRCTGGVAQLTAASPVAGWRLREWEPGPAREVEVSFLRSNGDRAKITGECAAETPKLTASLRRAASVEAPAPVPRSTPRADDKGGLRTQPRPSSSVSADDGDEGDGQRNGNSGSGGSGRTSADDD